RRAVLTSTSFPRSERSKNNLPETDTPVPPQTREVISRAFPAWERARPVFFLGKDDVFMILIGTDDGIYRWFQGSPWPIYHSLQGRAVVALAAQGGGLLAAADGGGRYWESRDNGINWVEVPLPTWAGGASA